MLLVADRVHDKHLFHTDVNDVNLVGAKPGSEILPKGHLLQK